MHKKTKQQTIFILEDDPDYQNLLHGFLSKQYYIEYAKSLQTALNSRLDHIDLFIIDICLDPESPQNKDGLDFINYLDNQALERPIIVLSGYAQEDVPEVVASSFKAGVIDYVRKSKITPAFLQQLINDSIDKYTLRSQVDHWKKRVQQLEGWEIIGDCPAIQHVKEEILKVAEDGYASVLITGETGTGKELVANAIHQKGWRKDSPFISFSVLALPQELIHRELFGHEKGAFTGADKAKSGYIEESNGGILFIDEIGEIPTEIQGLLLRILEERTFFRIGSTKQRNIDFQLVTATNQKLQEKLSTDAFRDDLFYRLNTFQIQLPSLKERGEDIILLSNYFLNGFRKQGRTNSKGFTSDVLKIFKRYSWPGNVRELKNTIERCVIKSKNSNKKMISQEMLPEEIVKEAMETNEAKIINQKINKNRFPVDMDKEYAKLELFFAEQALKYANGKKTEAWKLLKGKGFSSRYTFYNKILKTMRENRDLEKNFTYLFSLYKDSFQND